MPKFRLLFVIAGCLLAAMWVCFHNSAVSADAGRPAIAERSISPEDSLNPLVDLTRAKRKSEAKLRQALEKPVAIAFEKIPLQEAVRRLAQAADVNILISQDALIEEGVSGKEPVSVSSKANTLHEILQRMLKPLGLNYEIHSEVIRVTTLVVTDEMLVNRHYEVGDLLKWEESHRYEPRARTNTLFFTHRRHDWLVKLLEQQTSGLWAETDGTGGFVEFQAGTMTVRQTQAVQNEIPPILKMLWRFTEDKFGKDKSLFWDSLSELHRDLPVRRALAKPVTLNFEKTPLKQVLMDLSQIVNVPVRGDWINLAEEGMKETTPITFQIKNVTLDSALQMLLEPLRLGAIVSDGSLLITGLLVANERHVGCAYDVRDLIRAGVIDKDFFSQHLWMETNGPWLEVHGVGGTVDEPLPGLLVIRQTEAGQKELAAFFEDLRQHAKANRLPRRKVQAILNPDDVVMEFYALHKKCNPPEVKRAIYDMVEADSWESHGGTGSIRIINKLLVIKAQVKVHRQVNGFLVRISSTLKKQELDRPQPIPIPMWGSTGIGNTPPGFPDWNNLQPNGPKTTD